jgi:hypothetical protein
LLINAPLPALPNRKLQQRGVTTETPVGIFIPHCEEYMIGNIGVFRAGGAMFLLVGGS